MNTLRLIYILTILIGTAANTAYAYNGNPFKYPFYVGITGGYGMTTWEGLVPPQDKQNDAMAMSTPKEVNEGGALWGIFAGYELLPYFAVELSYLRYPDATINFDESSLFTFENDGITSFTTKTESLSLMGKVMMLIPKTCARAYASLGLAEVHRSDFIKENWRGNPTFGAGVNYNFTQHIMGELGGVYSAGQAQSELNPVQDYYPFLYSVYLRLAYRF
jgi:hypothetical protein